MAWRRGNDKVEVRLIRGIYRRLGVGIFICVLQKEEDICSGLEDLHDFLVEPK